MGAFQVALAIKSPPVSAGDIRDVGSIPGSGRSLRGGHGNLLQYPCLENPMDRGAWWATVLRVTKSQTQLSVINFHQSLALTVPIHFDMLYFHFC